MQTPTPDKADTTDHHWLSCSEFLAGWVAQHETEWAQLRAAGMLDDAATDPVTAPPAPGGEEFESELRIYRSRVLATIAWRDLAAVETLARTLDALTRLAECCIEAALQYAERVAIERYGALLDESGRPIRLIVIGMGKLGGRELNFSSDVDLIFARARSGESQGQRSLDADAWLTKVGAGWCVC